MHLFMRKETWTKMVGYHSQKDTLDDVTNDSNFFLYGAQTPNINMTPKNQNCTFDFPNDLTVSLGQRSTLIWQAVQDIFGVMGNTYVQNFYINEPISMMLV